MRWFSARLGGLAVPAGWALLSGVLQAMPFPIAGPVPLWRTQICWVAMVPLLWAVLGQRADGAPVSRMEGAALGYLSGFAWYMGSCYWIYETMHLYGALSKPVAAGILVLFCLYVGLYHALFGAVLAHVRLSRLGRQGALLLVPVLWVGVELARARVTGFPWDLLGTTQVDNGVLRRLAPWTGVYGLSFVIAAINALWLVRVQVRERRWTRPALAAAGTVLLVIYVGLALRPRRGGDGTTVRGVATLLQQDVAVGAEAMQGGQASSESLLAQFAALSRRPSPYVLGGMPEVKGTRILRRRVQLGPAAGPLTSAANSGRSDSSPGEQVEATDLVVWPESPAPFEEANPEFRQGIGELARSMSAPVIVGSIGVGSIGVGSIGAGGIGVGSVGVGSVGDGQTRGPGNRRGYDLFNSASMVAPTGEFLGRYDKVHLVPFGEYVPFKQLFFFAGSLLDQVGTFVPGQDRRVFTVGGHTYGVFICYESIFGDEVRQFAKMGAQVLVNISNDGWYGDTSAPWQHLNMLRMRAIENHRWVLRATNTGVTATIDPEGRVVASAPRHVRTAIRVPFAYETDTTFYAAHGDWFAWMCGLGAMVAIGYAEWSRRNGRTLVRSQIERR